MLKDNAMLGSSDLSLEPKSCFKFKLAWPIFTKLVGRRRACMISTVSMI